MSDSRVTRTPRVYTLGLVIEGVAEAVSKKGKSYRYCVVQLLDGSQHRAFVREGSVVSLCDYVCVSVSPLGDDFSYTAYPLRSSCAQYVQSAGLYVTEHLAA